MSYPGEYVLIKENKNKYTYICVGVGVWQDGWPRSNPCGGEDGIFRKN